MIDGKGRGEDWKGRGRNNRSEERKRRIGEGRLEEKSIV